MDCLCYLFFFAASPLLLPRLDLQVNQADGHHLFFVQQPMSTPFLNYAEPTMGYRPSLPCVLIASRTAPAPCTIYYPVKILLPCSNIGKMRVDFKQKHSSAYGRLKQRHSNHRIDCSIRDLRNVHHRQASQASPKHFETLQSHVPISRKQFS